MIVGRVGVTPNFPTPRAWLQLDAARSASPVLMVVWRGNMVQATGASHRLTASSANVNGLPSVVYDGTKVMATAALAATDPI